MKTLWNNTKMIERFLSDKLKPSHQLDMESAIKENTSLEQSISWQRKVHELVRIYHRIMLKKELAAMHTRLMQKDEEFRRAMQNIL